MSNGMNEQSTGRTLILIANIIQTIIGGGLLLIMSLSLIFATYGIALIFLPIVWIFVVGIIILSFYGGKRVHYNYSNGWSIFFIVIGVIFLFDLVGVLWLIGGILTLNHNNSMKKAIIV